VLPNTLDTRIAAAIKATIDEERRSVDTASLSWRQRCEVASVAALSDAERRVFLSHIAERRGSAVAADLEESASSLRTSAIFFLARKPS
jgi:phage baseplate assembly protein W